MWDDSCPSSSGSFAFCPDTILYLFGVRVGSLSLYWLCSAGIATLCSSIVWQRVCMSLTSFSTCLLSSLVPLTALDPHEEGGLAEPKLCGKLCSTWCLFWFLSLPTVQSIWSLWPDLISFLALLHRYLMLFSMSIKLPTFSPSFVLWLDPHHMIHCISYFVFNSFVLPASIWLS